MKVLKLIKTIDISGVIFYEIYLISKSGYSRYIKGFSNLDEALMFFDNYTPVDTNPVLLKEREV